MFVHLLIFRFVSPDDGIEPALRVLRLSDPEDTSTTDQKTAVGLGGHRVELSKNLWDGSGLKIESASTDVAWCSGSTCSVGTWSLRG